MNKDIVIISGGANGLGSSLVDKLINKEYLICVLDKDDISAKKLEEKYGSLCKVYIGDIADEDFVTTSINEISKLGNILCLINNAGEPSFKMPKEYKKKDINKCFKGLEGMILLTSNVLKETNEKNVKIVNIMSSAALRGNKQESVYCATKWGERGYTESLKVAYKGTSVKVIGVYPGGINTNFYKDSRDYVSIEKQNTFMNPNDVADIIVENVFSDKNLTVSDLMIERNQG